MKIAIKNTKKLEELANNTAIHSKITSLYLTNLVLEEIPNFVKNLVNLKSLDLAGGSKISDITALFGLSALQELDLGYNQISDISVLSELITLKELNLSCNQISDISALANMTNLKELYLEGNQISDISSLANLTNLKELCLDKNQINDISSLANLTNLKVVSVSSNKIVNISTLANLTNLKELYLHTNQISDISLLANLINLKTVSLSRNEINDISSLSGLSSLQVLYLSVNQISDISSLSGLSNLRELDLRWNKKITNYGALKSLSPNCEICKWPRISSHYVARVFIIRNFFSSSQNKSFWEFLLQSTCCWLYINNRKSWSFYITLKKKNTNEKMIAILFVIYGYRDSWSDAAQYYGAPSDARR